MLYHFESESHMQMFPTTSYHTILCCDGVNDCFGDYNGDIILPVLFCVGVNYCPGIIMEKIVFCQAVSK